ncbi:holin [Streptomyces sp. CA-181903]|uniref:holin n=1 Tax=Streptomyces sp. CA-181903 TaxID=3240055 RepID=UPI003D91FC7F
MNKKVLADIAERTIAAYLTTFLGLLIADGFDLTDVSALKAAAIAALPAALSVIKGAIGRYVGDDDSVAWLPSRRRSKRSAAGTARRAGETGKAGKTGQAGKSGKSGESGKEGSAGSQAGRPGK